MLTMPAASWDQFFYLCPALVHHTNFSTLVENLKPQVFKGSNQASWDFYKVRGATYLVTN